MKKVWIDDSCIACGACVDICPDVFELECDTAEAQKDADLSLEAVIEEAVESCPVEVIQYEK